MMSVMSMGNSGSAVSLLNELKSQGVHIWREGGTLRYRAPTGVMTVRTLDSIRGLKEDLLRLLEPDSASAFTHGAVMPYNVDLLHTGKLGQPVFCVHAADGGVVPYLHLAREISGQATTYGMCMFDRREKRRLPASLKAIARYYTHQMRKIQPAGKYFLVGWCSGGWIAFEIACELSRSGEKVGGLTLLDATVPPRAPSLDVPPSSRGLSLSGIQERTARTWWRLLSLQRRSTESKPLVPPLFWTMDDESKCRYLLEHRSDPQVLSPNSTLLLARDVDDVMFQLDMVMVQHDAMLSYEPSSYAATIDLFISAPAGDSTFNDLRRIRAENFWKARTTGVVRSAIIPGEHEAPLSKPGVLDIARCVLTQIREQRTHASTLI